MNNVYLLKLNLYDSKNKKLSSINNITIDDKIRNVVSKIFYNLVSQELMVLKEPEDLFIYSSNLNSYDILFKNNLDTILIKKIILENKKLDVGESNYNRLLYNVVSIDSLTSLNVLTIYELINEIKNIYNNINNDLLNDLYYNYIQNIFPLISFNSFLEKFKNTVSLNKNIILNIKNKTIDQVDILEKINNTEPSKEIIKNLIATKLILEANIKFVLKDLNIELDSVYTDFLTIKEFYLNLFNTIKLTINDNINNDTFYKKNKKTTTLNNDNNINIEYVGLNYLNNVLFKTSNRTLTEEIIVEDDVILYVLGYNIKFAFSLYVKIDSFIIDVKFNEQLINDLDLNYFINLVKTLLNSHLVESKIDKKSINSLYNFKIDINIDFDRNKVLDLIEYFDYYFTVIKNNDSVNIKFNLIDNYQSDNILNLILNYKNEKQIETFTQKDYEYLINKLNISINELKSNIELLDFSNKQKTEKTNNIKITKNNLIFTGYKNSDSINRIIFLVNNIFNLYFKNDELSFKIKSDYKNNDFYLSLIYYYNKIESTKYWSKECQNSGSKKRKPILFPTNDKYSLEFKYDEKTQSYIHPKTKERRLKINNIFVGCIQEDNITSHIGFLNSCSLCCFSSDQFTDVIRARVRNKIKSCLTLDIPYENVELNRSYIYKFPKIVGDIVVLNNLFIPFFGDSNYFLLLISLGDLNFNEQMNKLLFVDDKLVNVETFNNEPYEIYYYKYPFLFQVIYIKDVENINNFKTKLFEPLLNKFLIDAKLKFNILFPFNTYSIYKLLKTLFINYSYFKNTKTNIISFNYKNKLTFILNDINKFTSFNDNMFDDLVYNKQVILHPFNNKYVIELIEILKSINVIVATKLIFNKKDNIIGLKFNDNMYILFEEIKNIKSITETYNLEKELNIEILLYLNNNIDNDISADKLLNCYAIDSYRFSLFKYNFFLLIYLNSNIKKDINNIVENKEQKNDELRDEILVYLKSNKFQTVYKKFFKINKKINTDIEIDNNLSVQLNRMDNLFVITEEETEIFLKRLSNELMYPFNSMFNFTSRFIDNNYSEDIFLDLYSNIDGYNFINQKIGKLINNNYYQEIFIDNDESIYRALSNLYYWKQLEEKFLFLKEINFYDFITQINLGFYNPIQNSLKKYLQSILEKNVKSEDTKYVDIINEFIKLYNINIELIINNKVIETKQNKNDNLNIIYLNGDNKIITYLAVLIKIN